MTGQFNFLYFLCCSIPVHACYAPKYYTMPYNVYTGGGKIGEIVIFTHLSSSLGLRLFFNSCLGISTIFNIIQDYYY